jgi:hypothetical protein
MKLLLKFATWTCLSATAAGIAAAQYEGELTAKRRIFPSMGVGLRAVKSPDGQRTYVLSSQGLTVFDSKEQKLLTIGSDPPPVSPVAPTKAAPPGPTFAEDFDADSTGQIYVADRAANQIVIYSPDGKRVRSFQVASPVSVAALPNGEVAVATMQDPHLILVFDKNGREIREFGELEDISNRADLNRYLNAGYLASDARGEIFYAFIFTPEPIVRQYDGNGFALQTIEFTEIDAFAAAQAARKEIERQEKKGKQPAFKPILTAMSVVRDTGEVWIALHNRLLRFDKEGNRKATYQLYAPDGARLDANAILVQKDRIIIGSDTGAYEFERPDLKLGNNP